MNEKRVPRILFTRISYQHRDLSNPLLSLCNVRKNCRIIWGSSFSNKINIFMSRNILSLNSWTSSCIVGDDIKQPHLSSTTKLLRSINVSYREKQTNTNRSAKTREPFQSNNVLNTGPCNPTFWCKYHLLLTKMIIKENHSSISAFIRFKTSTHGNVLNCNVSNIQLLLYLSPGIVSRKKKWKNLWNRLIPHMMKIDIGKSRRRKIKIPNHQSR